MVLDPKDSLTVSPVWSRRERRDFIKLPWKIYKNDKAWIPPLLVQEKQRFNRDKNPFFEHGEGEYFICKRNGVPVGRISAHIDYLHNERYDEKTGFFGFFESENDPNVAKALLNTAAQWLRSRGMNRIRGPLNFSINEEAGLLVDGFDHAPVIMTNHNLPYYVDLLETWGLHKVKDLYCWRYDPQSEIPEPAMQIADEVRKYPGLVVREVRRESLEADTRILIDVFNSAWKKNWGFVPLTEKEIQKAVEDFKTILEPKIALIAEVEGKPAAICVSLPNLNEMIADLNGRIFPLGFLKLLYRIKRRKYQSGRLIMLGVKEEYRGSALGGLSVLLYTEIHRRAKALGFLMGELSWTLDDNQKINFGIEMMGGKKYKTYRLYERNI